MGCGTSHLPGEPGDVSSAVHAAMLSVGCNAFCACRDAGSLVSRSRMVDISQHATPTRSTTAPEARAPTKAAMAADPAPLVPVEQPAMDPPMYCGAPPPLNEGARQCALDSLNVINTVRGTGRPLRNSMGKSGCTEPHSVDAPRSHAVITPHRLTAHAHPMHGR